MGGGGGKGERCSGLCRKGDEAVGGGLFRVRGVSCGSRVCTGNKRVASGGRGRCEGWVDDNGGRRARCRERRGAGRRVEYTGGGGGVRAAGMCRRLAVRVEGPTVVVGGNGRRSRRPCAAARCGRRRSRKRRSLGERAEVARDRGRDGDEGGIRREAVVGARPRHADVGGHCTDALRPRSEGAAANCFGW